MNRNKKNFSRLSCLLFAVLLLGACTGRTYLMVDYHVPDPNQQLSGKSVRLLVKDLRDNTRIMAPAAGYHFRDFENRYSLAYVTSEKERILAGEHDLSQLVRETFAKRLERMGATVGDASQTHLPVLTITLEKLRIDLKERKWAAELKYNASLTQDEQLVVTETVHGNAERMRVVGRKGADAVLSDILTDAVNRLNLPKLFRRAKLHS